MTARRKKEVTDEAVKTVLGDKVEIRISRHIRVREGNVQMLYGNCDLKATVPATSVGQALILLEAKMDAYLRLQSTAYIRAKGTVTEACKGRESDAVYHAKQLIKSVEEEVMKV